MIPLTLLAGGGWKKLAMGLGTALVLFVLLGVAFLRGYGTGYKAADLERRAEVSATREDHALALAGAEAEARKRLDAATARAAQAEGKYLSAVKTIAAQRRTITRERIANASRTAVAGNCLFGPEWVRIYNEAIGAGTGDGGHPVPSPAPGADNATGAAPPADAGILQSVTPEDILAHIRDYGARNRQLEQQVLGWIEWSQSLNPKEDHP